MNRTKRTTANLPIDLLKEATKITGQGITGTLIAGLKMIRRSRAYETAQELRGKLKLDIDLESSRERTRR